MDSNDESVITTGPSLFDGHEIWSGENGPGQCRSFYKEAKNKEKFSQSAILLYQLQ